MATLQAATTSTGAIVSDPQAVRELCESYCFGTLDWKVTDEGELTNHKRTETAGLNNADQKRIEAARALLQDVSLLSQPEHSGDAETQIES
jgi:hypothetical protein